MPNLKEAHMDELEVKHLYSIDEAARHLGIGRTLLRRLIGEGRLPVVHLGRRALVPAQAVRRFVDELVADAAGSEG
jgi:excisionase family DNA binding protein